MVRKLNQYVRNPTESFFYFLKNIASTFCSSKCETFLELIICILAWGWKSAAWLSKKSHISHQ
jgi:hypothetical protein